jgi:hypothetical protein
LKLKRRKKIRNVYKTLDSQKKNNKGRNKFATWYKAALTFLTAQGSKTELSASYGSYFSSHGRKEIVSSQ